MHYVTALTNIIIGVVRIRMEAEEPGPKPPLIFVYYHFRGQLQALRNLCFYIQEPFHEAHLDRFEEQKKILPPQVLEQLTKFKLDRENLPSLIHGDILVEGQRTIARYIC
jgi:hypothetical protein